MRPMRSLLYAFLFCLPCALMAQSDEQVDFNLTELGSLSFPEDMADIWGYSDGEREYAIVGRISGFSVVDVTDPFNPVELHQVDGPNSLWRDVKTFGQFAYGVHENEGPQNQGLIIMDLSRLPGQLPVTFWTGDVLSGNSFGAAHNIFIDEHGIAYLSGHNGGNGGVLMVDIGTNPTNPDVVGAYEDRYVHDCFVRGDTLWTAEVNNGDFSIVDISDKGNPQVLARQETPRNFTHNVWLSDDGRTLYTTDERSGAPVGSYDVSDVEDITLLDEYRSASNVIPHNAFVRGDNVIVSYYTHGLIILDATLPDALVEVGRYDTSPNFAGSGFHGAWGVYPYLPSGNILVSDIEEGLFVLRPEYQVASRIMGKVTNANESGLPIPGVTVSATLNGQIQESTTELDGKYLNGFLVSGTVTLNFSKPGFLSEQVVTDLGTGENKTIDIELEQIIVNPTDTVYIEVFSGEASTYCIESVTDPDNSFVCSALFQSDFGQWDVDPSGCLIYEADNSLGEFVDTICFSVTNSSTSTSAAQVVVVSIARNPVSSVSETAKSTFSIRNPVRQSMLVIQAGTGHEANRLDIYNTNGQHVHSQRLDPGSNQYLIALDQLSTGTYFAQFSSEKDVLETAKLMVID